MNSDHSSVFKHIVSEFPLKMKPLLQLNCNTDPKVYFLGSEVKIVCPLVRENPPFSGTLGVWHPTATYVISLIVKNYYIMSDLKHINLVMRIFIDLIMCTQFIKVHKFWYNCIWMYFGTLS